MGVEFGPGLFTRNPEAGVALDLLRQLRSGLSSSVGVLPGILLSDTTSFVQLHVCNVAVVVNLGVNLLLVVDIDVWPSEGENGTKEGQAPEWEVLDQEIAEEGCDEGSNSCEEILDERNPLELDNDEVQEVMDLFKDAFDVFPGDGIVSPRPHLAHYSLVSEVFSSVLQRSNGPK